MRSEELTLRAPHCLNLRAALARGMRRLDADGEAPLPTRAAARLPILAPVGRFVPLGYCDDAENLPWMAPVSGANYIFLFLLTLILSLI